MATTTPYTYIQCPCSNLATVSRAQNGATGQSQEDGEQEEDDTAFDPRAPRSAYGLYPLEYLMYCEDCQEIRCQRCVNEEIVAYYCPNCLFEVPSSNIKSEGNRCTRSCFQCPVCLGPMTGHTVDKPKDPGHLMPPPSSHSSSSTESKVIFTCNYCNWCSAEVGLVFEKGGAFVQLARMANDGGKRRTVKDHRERRKENPDEPPVPDGEMTPDLQFNNLKAFYSTQLAEASSGSASTSVAGLSDFGFSSPAAMNRLINMYAGGSLGGKRQQGRVPTMREAKDTDEGLVRAELDEAAEIGRLQAQNWHDTPNLEQRTVHHETWRTAGEYRPVPMLLRTKRSKRCPVCRHIITKPEAKVANVRYRIRLVASNYVPTIKVKPMPTTGSTLPPLTPITPRTAPPRPAVAPQQPLLAPGMPVQFVLTFTNPIFEPVKVTLAAPAATPGRFPSKVTLLCPQFTIQKNYDMWDDALKDDFETSKDAAASGDAGKIYDQGRNWVSVVMEIVPGSLRLDGLKWAREQGEDVDDGPLKEDEDILEIPMLVRIEWEADVQELGVEKGGRDKAPRDKRELAYWCVLGIGKIAQE